MKMKMKKFIAPVLSLTLLMPGIAGATCRTTDTNDHDESIREHTCG